MHGYRYIADLKRVGEGLGTATKKGRGSVSNDLGTVACMFMECQEKTVVFNSETTGVDTFKIRSLGKSQFTNYWHFHNCGVADDT